MRRLDRRLKLIFAQSRVDELRRHHMLERVVGVLDRGFAKVYGGRCGLLAYLLSAPLAELHFYYLTRRFLRKRAADRHHTHSLGVDANGALRMWERLVASSTPQQIDALLRGWFDSASDAAPRRGNVLDLMSWNIFNLRLDELSASQRQAIDCLLERVEDALGRPLAAGRDAGLRPLAMTIDWICYEAAGRVHCC